MQMWRIGRLAMVVSCALVMGGCMAGGVSPRPSGNSGMVQTGNVDMSHPGAKLVIGSEKLLGMVGLIQPRFRRVGILTQAAVTVQNFSENRYSLEYKVDWETQDGFPIQNNPVWHRFTLTPHQAQTFSSMGKTPDSERIVFTIRFPDDAFIELDGRDS